VIATASTRARARGPAARGVARRFEREQFVQPLVARRVGDLRARDRSCATLVRRSHVGLARTQSATAAASKLRAVIAHGHAHDAPRERIHGRHVHRDHLGISGTGITRGQADGIVRRPPAEHPLCQDFDSDSRRLGFTDHRDGGDGRRGLLVTRLVEIDPKRARDPPSRRDVLPPNPEDPESGTVMFSRPPDAQLHRHH